MINQKQALKSQSGFTLIELLIFIIVLGIALSGVLTIMNVVVKSSADPMINKQALSIAESLLEEITLKDYADPLGGDVSTVRAQFDDVDQYSGYVTAGGMKDAQGGALAGLERYNASPAVSVVAVTLGGVNVKKITVTITGPNGPVSISGYRGNY